MTERVSFKSRAGGATEGALALPEAASAPGLVVIHEWWGVNEQIVKTCERFAAAGFAALAVDVYHGKVVPIGQADEAGKAMAALDWTCALDDIAGAVEYLRGHPRCKGKVAVTGFCMGGALSFAAAASVPDLAAVVPFYGVPSAADWSKVTAPIQAHFARIDDWAKPELAEKIQATLREQGKPMELHVYDAQHAFCNEARPEVYDRDACETAWKRTLDFLKRHTT
jgi:carboxymethylenebutenolidase